MSVVIYRNNSGGLLRFRLGCTVR